MACIEIERLTKTFVTGRRWRHLLFPGCFSDGPRRVTALNEVTLHLERGEFFGLVGPNGSGKTTLLKILASLILPDSGTVHINGFSHRKCRSVRGTVGLVTGDDRSFYWRLTGRQNLEFFASLYPRSREKTGEKIGILLEKLEIGDPDRPFQEYSTGMKQRFALVRALLPDPEILLLDEPARSLDNASAKKFFTLVRHWAGEEGRIALCATHVFHGVAGLFTRAGLLRDGRLVRQGEWKVISEEYLC